MPNKFYFKKITLTLAGWRYFFMAMINTIKVMIYIIMYTYSIITTSLPESVRSLNAPTPFADEFEMA